MKLEQPQDVKRKRFEARPRSSHLEAKIYIRAFVYEDIAIIPSQSLSNDEVCSHGFTMEFSEPTQVPCLRRQICIAEERAD